ncbi:MULTISPECIES: type II toxin-antitoxin system SpoIISA family toxin [unclassified Exiguobacterium]|uniref:type II toxin-antitoxin system SpoIISA family toxin n=1 Tax=unclassified Exiguobacterium TaxID=2644629 RepID=UPI001BE9E10C|nr:MULTISPECIES: type II toxin-antitoxin system SpoIISA family toxin [unclassified Exiguobacterium]
MNITTGFTVIGYMLLLVLALSTFFHFWNRKSYLKNRTLIRKVYYLLVITSTYYLFLQDSFPFQTTTGIVGFVIGVIVIDLMVLQTPDITKFMSHELKQEEYTDRIEKNEGNVQLLTEKILKTHEMMPKPSEPWWMEDEFDFSPEGYENSMKQYLERYTGAFDINLFSYFVESSAEQDVFSNNLKEKYRLIKEHQELKTRTVGMRDRDAVAKLVTARNIEIFNDGQTTVIFPYFGEYYNFILVITGRNGVHVGGADAALLLNLMYTFDAWLLSNEMDFDDFGDDIAEMSRESALEAHMEAQMEDEPEV